MFWITAGYPKDYQYGENEKALFLTFSLKSGREFWMAFDHFRLSKQSADILVRKI